MKICSKCEKQKELTAFYADKQKTDGKTSVCKSCINEMQAKARKNPQYIYCFNKYQKEWQKSYRKTPRYKAWRKTATAKMLEKARLLKQEIINHYGGKCACCGITDPFFLSVDHINNDGYLERRGKIRRYRPSGYFLYKRIIKANFPNDLQILCFNCNIAKQHNKGICPHKSI